MKYCTKCGQELNDDALFCSRCGQKVESPVNEVSKKTSGYRDKTMLNIGFILCVVATVINGFAIIPLIWQVPLTVSLYRKINNNERISVGFKVVILIFVSLIGGVLLIVGDDEGEL
ncbi:MAG: zinc-ribbon domain-containing protein [Bacilli bacterium]|nr:zinc-ribbon domain-containing protein [Bacilli bacterium]